MKSNRSFLPSAIMFLVFAVVFSVTIWGDVSLPARIAFFALGFGSGISTGLWIARRVKK